VLELATSKSPAIGGVWPNISEHLTPASEGLVGGHDDAGPLVAGRDDFGASQIDLPSGLPESVPDFYFQAPGGQCFQLLPIEEDQSYYKGAEAGPNVAKEQEAEVLKEKTMSELASGIQKKAN
jgi:hypothetical protein